MYDTIEKLGRSTVQHGKFNDRIYLMKLDTADFPAIISLLESMAQKNGYGKVFVKAPGWTKAAFEKSGYTEEALVPSFYNRQPASFLAKYPRKERGKLVPEDAVEIAKTIQTANGYKTVHEFERDDRFDIRLLGREDAEALAALYQTVFQSYPFPIFSPDYLTETMAENTRYFGAFFSGRLVAAAGSEMDPACFNAEMTDFATVPEHRKENLAFHLLKTMETEMKKKAMKTLYTIARSHSAGINILFAKGGYTYAGTLRNNTNIAGKIESMNVWYKTL